MSAIRLAHILRHPIKSVGVQEIERAALTEGRPLPFDRLWAIATQAAGFDSDLIDWAPKSRFLRGAAEGRLQAIRATLNEATGVIRLTHPERPDFHGDLAIDGAALVDWLRPLWPETRSALDRLVRHETDGALADVPEPYLSILSLKSNRILGQRMGLDLSLHRWRGNLWLEGLAPWEEFDLIGRSLQIGTARLRIEQRITRCVATTFDPVNGRKSGDTLAALDRGFGHQDFGVYARVISSGQIAQNDEVTLLP